MANINKLLQELRDLTKDVNSNEIISYISIPRGWLDSWHTQFSRIADELEQVISATLENDPYDAVSCEHVISPDTLHLILDEWDVHPGGTATNEKMVQLFSRTVATSNGTKLTAEQVREAIRKYAEDDSCYIFEVYGEKCGLIADELNAELGNEICEPKWTLQGKTQTQEFWSCKCGNCDEFFGIETRESFPFKVTIDKVNIPNYCPNCGVRVLKNKK